MSRFRLIRSPYVLTPQIEVSTADLWDVFFSTQFSSPLLDHKDDAQRIPARYQAHVAAEFYRLFLDKRFSKWNMKRGKGKKVIHLEAKFWVRLFELIERLGSFGRINQPPVLLFHQVISERSLTMMRLNPEVEVQTPKGLEIRNAEIVRKQWMSQNKALSSYCNPWTPSTPATYKLIDISIRTAEQSDLFRKQRYKPLVAARSALTERYKKDGQRVLYNGREISRGPKRKNKTKH